MEDKKKTIHGFIVHLKDIHEIHHLLIVENLLLMQEIGLNHQYYTEEITNGEFMRMLGTNENCGQEFIRIKKQCREKYQEIIEKFEMNQDVELDLDAIKKEAVAMFETCNKESRKVCLFRFRQWIKEKIAIKKREKSWKQTLKNYDGYFYCLLIVGIVLVYIFLMVIWPYLRK